MAPVFRKYTKRIFIVINIVICGLYVLACCNAFLPPQTFWFISILGIGFPFLLILVSSYLIFWIIFRSRWAFLSLACILIGYTNIRALLGFHYGKNYTTQKPSKSIRVLSWNVSWFDEQKRSIKNRITFRKDILEFIKKMNPDILCFQEYVEPNTRFRTYNNRSDITNLGYPYSMVATDYTGWKNTWQAGIAIFSKYPIIDSLHTHYPGPKAFRAGESLIATDINYNGHKIRVFTTHLQSFVLKPKDYRDIQIIKSASDSMLEASKSVFKKLAQGYKFRGQQVDIVKRYLDASPYPTVICGDFNDIPNSYTYFKIRANRQDAFTEAGKGIGRTFSNLAPTLRIDYIMPDKHFDVLQYFRFFLPYSEHYPVIADIALQDSAN
jgi:endonuclease/exonuclease/phosphatase family metal-dependent hydrolase